MDIFVSGVGKVYETGAGSLEALSGVSCRMLPGEFVSLLGPSGCGKSTLLKILAGLIERDGGEVSIGGRPPQAGRRDLGIMLQRPVLLPWRSVKGNVGLPLAMFGAGKERRERRVSEVLEMVGLSAFAEANTWELSGGMQQRVALARSLSFEPSTLLMDEPFGALDELTRERLNLEVAAIQSNQGATTVLVTHSVQEAVLMSDRILIMRDRPGRIVGEVPIELARPRRSDMVDTPVFAAASRAARKLLGLEMEAGS